MSDFKSGNQDAGMDHMFSPPPQELHDLLSDRALSGLDAQSTRRLEQLLEEYPWVREDYLDDAVAMMEVAFEDSEGSSEPLPQDVADRIKTKINALAVESGSPAVEASPAVAGTISPSSGIQKRESAGLFGWAGWAAAAAMLVFSVMLWQPVNEPVGNAAQLVSWSEQHPDAVRWDWAPGLANPAEGVTGYVTFSPEAQEGFMMIKGLEPNDPRIQQYQLWIWDRDREPDPNNPQPLAENVHPVDGGVFDVNDRGEVVIPMKLPLRVDQPYLFAVTVERPGGVVKSDKSSVPLIAGPPADA